MKPPVKDILGEVKKVIKIVADDNFKGDIYSSNMGFCYNYLYILGNTLHKLKKLSIQDFADGPIQEFYNYQTNSMQPYINQSKFDQLQLLCDANYRLQRWDKYMKFSDLIGE